MILVVCANPSIDCLITMDGFKAGVNRVKEEKPYPGGKGLHVAMALNEYDEEVTVLGFWGGSTGEWLRGQCAAMGIKTDGITVKHGQNRNCYTFDCPGEFKDSEILGVGVKITPEDEEEFNKIFAKYLKTADLCVISGSAPAGVSDKFYAQLVAKAPTKIIIDFTGTQLQNALPEHPAGIHLNFSETLQLGDFADAAEAARELLKYTDNAAITAGSRGLFFGHKTGVYHSHCDIAKVYSSVGCGDCLTAGAAWGIARNLPAEETAKYAAAFGTANLLREELGMLYAKDIDKLLKLTNVEKI